MLFTVPTVIQLQGFYQEIENNATIQNWISHVNKGDRNRWVHGSGWLVIVQKASCNTKVIGFHSSDIIKML